MISSKLFTRTHANKLALSVVVLLLGLLAACGGADAGGADTSGADTSADAAGQAEAATTAATPSPAPSQDTEPTAAPDVPAPLDLAALGQATYTGIYDEPITLDDGYYEGEPFVEGGASRPTVTLLTEPVVFGDLNGDGQPDAAVALLSETGGSGAFIYLAVAASDGATVNTTTTPLGDRVQISGLVVEDGAIQVTLLTHGPEDPACCPSQEVVRTFRLQDGQLVEAATG